MKVKKVAFITTLIVLISFSVQAQKKTYAGAELALSGDIFEYYDPFNLNLIDDGLFTGSLGIIIGQEISKNLLLESGLIRKDYDLFQVWQIPLRLKSKINLMNQKFFFTPTVGYSLCFNSGYGEVTTFGFGRYNSYSTTTVQNYLNNSLTKNFSLIQAGIGLEYMMLNGFTIYLSSSYYAGWKRVIYMNINTEINGISSDESYSTSNGSYWNIAFGVNYAISNFWKK